MRVKRALAILALLLAATAHAQEYTSANYKVTTLTVDGGASTVDATNATIDSANYRSLLSTDQVAVTSDRTQTSANYKQSLGHVLRFWGLGTSTDEWIGTLDAGVETSDLWTNAYDWGYGVPVSATTVNVGVARSGARLTGTGSCDNTTVASTGSLELTAGSTLQVATSIGVSTGATLKCTTATPGNRATVTRTGAGTYTATVDGTVNLNWVWWRYLAASGLQVRVGATVTRLDGIKYSDGAAGGLYLDLSAATSATVLPGSMNQCTFDAGPTNNVRGAGAGATHTNVTFVNWAGTLGGEASETNDPMDLIDWGSGSGVVRISAGGQPTYTSIADALLAVTANGETIEVRDNVIRDEVLDLSAFGFLNVMIDGAILKPPTGSVAVTGSGNSATGEILANCVIVRGGGAAPLVRNVGRIYHCTILGSGTIVDRAAGTMTLQSSIVMDPASWTVGTPIAGAPTATYCDVTGGFAGAGNINSDPLLVNYDPGSGMYDVHLKATSPCIDAATPIAGVTTDMDRGTDSSDPATNPRRPMDAPDGTAGFGTWDNNPAAGDSADIGADEFGPLLLNGTSIPQGVPWCTNRATLADPDSYSRSALSFDFPLAVLFLVENNTVTSGGTSDVRLVAFDLNDGNADGKLDTIESKTVNAGGVRVQKVTSIMVQIDSTRTKDDVFMVCDTESDSDAADPARTPDAILAFQYDPSAAAGSKLVKKAAWATNPMTPAGSGTIGRPVIGQTDGNLYFVRGDGRIYRHLPTDGTPAAAAGTWQADGRDNLVAAGYDGMLDAEGSLFAGKFNNSLYVPVSQHGTYELIRVACTDGSVANAGNIGTSSRNHNGFNLIAGTVLATAVDTQVWRLDETNLTSTPGWPVNLAPPGAAKTITRATLFLRNDATLRVGVNNWVYKVRRLGGGVFADSDGVAGPDDWGSDRPMRGNLTTPPIVVGSKGLGASDISPNDGRRGAKMFFGTDQGYCYLLSFIRATTAAQAEELGDRQPANPARTFVVTDGRPYPGFPYRLPGTRVQDVSLGFMSALGKNVVIFVMDNGWVYSYLEPY